MRTIILHVAGLPAPQGSKTRMPNGAMLEAGSKTGRAKHKAWRAAVKAAAEATASEHPGTPLDCPLSVTLTFSLPMPKSRPAKVRIQRIVEHAVKPDIDKLIRSTFDGLTAGGLIIDDSRISHVEAMKHEVADHEKVGATIMIIFEVDQ